MRKTFFKGSRKSKGKGKGSKGSGKGLLPHTKTPDDRKICFKYNLPNEVCSGACAFVHVCARCFGNRSMRRCEAKEAATKEKENTA